MTEKEKLHQELASEIRRLQSMYLNRDIADFLGINSGKIPYLASGNFRSPWNPKGVAVSSARATSLIALCEKVPLREPHLHPRKTLALQEAYRAQARLEHERSRAAATQEREAVFRGIQTRLGELRTTETFSDLARRITPLLHLRRLPSGMAVALSKINSGVFHNARGNFLFSLATAEAILAVLNVLEPVQSPDASERVRAHNIKRGKSYPSIDPAPGVLLEWAAGQIKAWIEGGVHVGELSRRLEAAGCRVHQTKLSRLYIHGPVRLDRPDTYLVSPQLAVNLVTALRALGQAPAPLEKAV